ncbi:MAG: helix-turn-helix domain-containing protein, partial [Nocardioidaceae bacterium]|nr:helix-turn-helix domain-containing protein [Nocardioidaceae bacterium]
GVVLEMCRANTSIVVDYLARGVALESVAPTEEVVSLTRVLVRSGVSMAAITRAYSLGIQYLIEVWSDAVRRHGPRDKSALEVVQSGTAFLMTRMDVITAQSADEYRIELERLAREQSLARVEDVRRVLSDDGIDIDAAGERLSYRIRGRHRALVLRDESARPDGSAVDRTLRDLVSSLQSGRGLSVRVDLRTTWWWIPASAVEGKELPVPTDAVTVAVGRPGAGLDGFRTSHRDALDGLRVAEMMEGGAPSVTRYDDVELVAMCSVDRQRFLDFIVVELGDLVRQDASTRRLRTTLAAFYAANSNYRAAGEELGVHHNTVRYRVEQASVILGRPVSERRLATELALHFAGVMDGSHVGARVD